MSLSLLGTDKQITLAADPLCLLRCKVKVKVFSIAEGEGTDALRVGLCVMCVCTVRGKTHIRYIFSVAKLLHSYK